jgi:translocation and assembly module TamB
MADSPPPPAARPPSTPHRRPPWLTSIVVVLVPAAAIVAVTGLLAFWLGTTAPGLRALLWAGAWAVPSLQATGVRGSLVEGFTLERIMVDEPGFALVATDVVVNPAQLNVQDRVIDLAQLSAGSAIVTWVPGDTKSSPEAPASLALPLSLRLRDVTIGELRLGERGQEPHVVLDVRLRGQADADAIRIEHASARYGPSEAVLAGSLGAARPFPLSAHAELRSIVLDKPVQAVLDASGSLLDLALAARSDTDAGRLDAQARITPFSAVPLAALSLTIADFEPDKWLPDVPAMRLEGTADLQPQPGADFTLAGPFQLTNALTGAIDRQRLPVQSARGTVRWSAAALDLALDRIEVAGGNAQASAVRSADGTITGQVTFRGIDAARVHTSATATQASGQLDFESGPGRQRFTGRATNARGLPIDLDFAVTVADDIVEIERAIARLDEGRADVSGRVQLGQATTAQLRGEFRALDLSKVVAGVDTRLNGSLSVDGTLQPVRRGRANVALNDSRVYGRPIEGRADLQLDGDRLDVDTDLLSGDARLRASGGIGGGRELLFDIQVPRLGDFVASLGGSVSVQGKLGGTSTSPWVEATATGAALLLPGQQRIAQLDARLRGGLAPDAPLDVEVTLSGHKAPGRPELWLSTASLTAQGTTSAHAIELDAKTETGEPLALRASGGWLQDAWRGKVDSLAAGKPLDLLLEGTAPLVVAADRITLGPARLTVRETRFTEVEFSRGDGRWRTFGAFANLQPQALDPRARAARRAVRTTAVDPQPLTLGGRWNLEYAETLNGIFVIERTSGDLYSGADAIHAIGVSDVGAALSIVDNRVTGTAYLRGRALGKVDAVIDAYVDPAGLRLAQDRDFRVNLDATLPDLGWIGPLISDAVQIQGSATVQAAIGGTPGNPSANGQVRGRDLRLVWIEQGFRLENGTLNAALEDGVLVLDEMTFTGEARVPPDDARALGALTTGQPGTLKVVGRVALQTLTGSIGITATRLPILQRRDRWMVVSGEGGITLTPKRAELYAKPTVDGAYFDFSSLRGPRTLPSDVVVVQREQPRTERRGAPPMDVVLKVDARLGQRFYIRGAGLEARLAGGVAVTGRPAQLQAVGTVRIVDGIYNGYGQRLQIQRGLVTFSGPLGNPALNVLAVRSGLPVEVGVLITGTALAPIVQLHSDTAMSDVERLNWLVLGRSAGTGEGQEAAMLTAAATAIFAGQSGGAASNVMRSLGIDEFGIRSGYQGGSSMLPRETVAGTLRRGSSSSAAGDFVALGKRINDQLYVTFEQALSGSDYFVALNYQLTRRLSLIARAGSTNALDLVYSLAFD